MAQEVAGSSLVYHPNYEYTEARFGGSPFFCVETCGFRKKTSVRLSLSLVAARRHARLLRL